MSAENRKFDWIEHHRAQVVERISRAMCKALGKAPDDLTDGLENWRHELPNASRFYAAHEVMEEMKSEEDDYMLGHSNTFL